MSVKTDKIGKYLKLSNEITDLESGISTKRSELERKYLSDYAKLKKEISAYLSKIRPTVEILCNLYKSKAIMQNGKIHLSSGILTLKYNCLNACEVAIKSSNEGVKFLSSILQRANIDVNLQEFAIRYNTVVDIYTKADQLCKDAIDASLHQYTSKIDVLKAEQRALYSNGDEFNSLISRVKENGRALYSKIMIEDRMELASELVTEISLPLGYDSCSDADLGGGGEENVILSSLDWNLHKDGALVIKADNGTIDSPQLSRLVVNTVIRFLFSYPALYKKILLCDSTSSNALAGFVGMLKNENSKLFLDNTKGNFVKNFDDDIRVSLADLNRIIYDRLETLGPSGYSTVLDFNHNTPDNPSPLILVLLNGYPSKYDAAADDIISALKNGKNAGVFFLIIENTENNEDTVYYRNRMPKAEEITSNIVEFKINGKEGYLYKNGKNYHSDTCGKKYNVGAILKAFKEDIKIEKGKIVYLDSVVGKEDFSNSPRRKKFSKTLSIPFGKQGSNPISIDLNANSTDAHLAIIGATGSGKTAFLNTFILSASKLYSPAELELHLIVMVKGGFRIFSENELPHLKTVVTGSNIFAANDVLDLINDELSRRERIIGSYENIYAYNEVAAEPLPRCIIIIDEFSQLIQDSDDAAARITKIANTGRAFGISLVISSQRFPMEISSVLSEFGNRIEFKTTENAGQLIPQAAKRQSELEGGNGLCFFSKGGNIHNVTVAFSEEGDRLKEHIEEVKNKFPEHRMELRNEIRSIHVANEKDAPFTVGSARLSYIEEGVIRTRLGRSYLTNAPLEYLFESENNNLLFLFGHYLVTKPLEAAIMKDVLVLSKDVDQPSVYYIDCNQNRSLKRIDTVIKRLNGKWNESGKLVFGAGESAKDTLEEVVNLIQERENDSDISLHPVLVVITKAEELFNDDNYEDTCAMISRGKETNVYFAIQCNEPIRFYGYEKYMTDAIIFPDRHVGDDEAYSSASLCAALEVMPAGSTDKGKKLINNAGITALDPRIHLLCNNNKLSLFIPYDLDEEYLKNIVN